MGTIIVGFGHKARQGKDTLARMVHELLAQETKIYSFAAALRAYCRVSGWMKEKDAPMLQYVGTDLFRKSNPDIWVETLKHQIEEEAPAAALITDMRFPNELRLCAVNGFTVNVTRYNFDGTPYIAPDRRTDHPSETALDGCQFDFYIANQEGSTDALTQGANAIALKIKEQIAQVAGRPFGLREKLSLNNNFNYLRDIQKFIARV